MLTEHDFLQFKRDWPFWRPDESVDDNGDVTEIIPYEPSAVVHAMWQTETDRAVAEGYGRDITDMRYCIAYGDRVVRVGDVTRIDGILYDVVGVPKRNTHYRIDIARRRGQDDGDAD